MDEVKIESKFVTGIVSRFIKKVAKDRLGYNVDVRLNKFRTTILDGKTHIHLDVDLELDKEELDKLIKVIGI